MDAILGFLQTIGPFLFVLGVLIFVHELGHFLVARWYGVKVLAFSLGFGPKLFKVTRGDTEYCISVIPLGRNRTRQIFGARSKPLMIVSAVARAGGLSAGSITDRLE